MNTSSSTNDLVRNLIRVGEFKLATRVLKCNIQTELIALRGRAIKRKVAKFEFDRLIQESRIDQISNEIPKIIMSHQKK